VKEVLLFVEVLGKVFTEMVVPFNFVKELVVFDIKYVVLFFYIY